MDSPVRLATMADYQECFRLFLQAHKENGMQFSFAPDKIDWILIRFLGQQIAEDDPGIRGIIGVIGPRGAIEAVCGVCLADLWYTHDKHLSDFLVFVDPEHRNTNHAKSMIRWMKEQADIIGVPYMSGVVTNERTEAKCRLFRREMPKVGELFLYRGPGVTMGSSISGVSLAAH